jgi:hypothetical protein
MALGTMTFPKMTLNIMTNLYSNLINVMMSVVIMPILSNDSHDT